MDNRIKSFIELVASKILTNDKEWMVAWLTSGPQWGSNPLHSLKN
jgi:hypothetical protein